MTANEVRVRRPICETLGESAYLRYDSRKTPLPSSISMAQSRRQKAISKSLQTKFLREVLAAGAGVPRGNQSIETLSAIGLETRYDEFRDRLRAYFSALEPYRRFGDFQGLDTLSRPRPLQLHIEPSILHGHFRAWLRGRGANLK